MLKLKYAFVEVGELNNPIDVNMSVAAMRLYTFCPFVLVA